MNIVVDYGNSFAKVGIFDNQNLVKKHSLSSPNDLQKLLVDTAAENLIISSVKTNPDAISSWSNSNRKFILNHSLPLPIKNLYATPATLGVDRLAGVCAANLMFPNQNSLVIDAGTCITFDFIDKNGAYHGGAISPGMNMRFQAVHTFTAKLPLISPNEHIELIGDSTETCIQSGVIYGLQSEIEGIIGRYIEKFEDLRVILCGGDAQFFEKRLKASIFAVPDLVLIGLNSILIYNVNR